ncbi:Shedu immune nuclease family protein [Pseudomonas sp. RIT-To-2]|uniref:Shedu immune nuclease family protein n=1 Tax=Pseudomonas sp. RIT-To-2 TaxID=3462541 RepID=UPI00241396CC
MAKTERRTLFNLKAEIELVTLGELIEVFAKMLTSNAKEAQWQTFLSEHPFVLDMAFGYPVKMIAERLYVGGKSFTGRGGQHSDFLVAAKATGNLALIEIKHAQHDLLGKLYRNKTYMPSEELSGSVAQVISQRALVHRNILILADELDDRVHAHAVAAIIIIGRTPDTREKQRAFEQYRNSLKDVLIVTFDELEERLRSIHRALVSSPPTVPIEDDDLPF